MLDAPKRVLRPAAPSLFDNRVDAQISSLPGASKSMPHQRFWREIPAYFRIGSPVSRSGMLKAGFWRVLPRR